MPQINSSFGGSTLIIPSIYYQDNVANVLPAAAFPGLPLVFIANGYGGQPNIPYSFSDPNQLKAFMRGSASARFVDFLSNPSSQVPGAQNFIYINPAPNTGSSATLYSSAASAVVNMSAVNFGSPGNALLYTVAAGSVAGINLTISDPAYTGLSFTGNNLGVPFQLTYNGSATAVKYVVTATGGLATNFTISGGNAGENVNLDLTSSAYSTISSIVQYLNSNGHYTALLLSPDANLPSSGLDAIAATSLPITTAVNITATLADIAYWVNNTASQLVTAAVASGVTSIPSLIPAVTANVHFTGGVNNSPSNSNYGSAFNAALNVNAWVVFADNGNVAVQALGQQHVTTASSIVSKRWRRFVTGSALGDSVNTTVTNAQALNALNCTYVYPGIQAVDPVSGINTTYSGLYGAACVAGMMAGAPFAVPFTNKAVNATGLEVLLTTAQINTLQAAGVMPLYISPATGVPTIVSDLTTWQNDNNPENVFNQQVACRYALAYTLTNNLQPYVGQVASTQSMIRVQNAIVASLNASIYNDASQQGFLNSWNPASLVLTYNGTTQTLSATVNVVFVGQYRFITMTVSVQPLSLTNTPQA